MSTDISEAPHVLPQRDWSFYAVLCLFVAPIWATVPLSWSYVLHVLLYRQALPSSRLCTTLFVIALCESLFSVYYTIRTLQISPPAPNPPNGLHVVKDALRHVLQAGMADPAHPDTPNTTIGVDRPTSPNQEIIKLIHSDPRAIDFRNFIRTWFGKVPWSQIHTREVEAWLYWSMFNATLPPRSHQPVSHQKLLQETITLLEMRAGKPIQKGSNPNVTPLLLTLDPVNVCARPLMMYLGVKVAGMLLQEWYRHQFELRYGRFGDLEYLIRIPKGYNRSTGPDPIVFIHGLGLGVVQYHTVLSHLCEELSHVPLLIPLQPQLSQDIFHPRFLKPMRRHEKADLLGRLLCELGWAGSIDGANKGVTVLSHSNGSFVHAWLLKNHPELVSRSCFVDPVTFCSWEGDVCYNFVYGTCTNGLQLLIRYFVATELGVSNLLQRHFDWLDNSLWFDEIPNARDSRKNVFVLGGKDSIVNASRVQSYLQSHGVTDGLWIDPNGHHGQALLIGGKGMTRIMNFLKDTPKAE